MGSGVFPPKSVSLGFEIGHQQNFHDIYFRNYTPTRDAFVEQWKCIIMSCICFVRFLTHQKYASWDGDTLNTYIIHQYWPKNHCRVLERSCWDFSRGKVIYLSNDQVTLRQSDDYGHSQKLRVPFFMVSVFLINIDQSQLWVFFCQITYHHR